MPFSIRPHRRFPVTYHAGLSVRVHEDSEGQGTIWNVWLNGWCLSGDLPVGFEL
jgi:hypothetical protein